MEQAAAQFNFRQLTLAREYRGLSQSELSEKIAGLSQPNLSKFEKGLGGLSDETLENVISYLDFPRSFFYERISYTIEHAHFRKKSTITKKQRLSFNTNIKLIGFLVDKLADSVEWPDYSFSSFDVEDGFSPEYIAQYIRKRQGINEAEPIYNIFHLLEKNGVVVVEFDPKSEKFDGVSFITETGTPVIVINKTFPSDRKRFTLAHELGHIVMHILNEAPISEYRDREDEANRFAAEFLMPASAISGSLRNLKISDLGGLKTYWLTSMASIIYRAKSLDIIDSERVKYLNIELSRRGYRKNEPYEVGIDEPKLFETAYYMHKNQLAYNTSDFVNGFSLPIDIITSYFQNSSAGKLRVVV